jgi:hypothetical protein
MKECQAGGIYEDTCKKIDGCLLLEECRDGDPDATPWLAKRQKCPDWAVKEITRLCKERAKQTSQEN